MKAALRFGIKRPEIFIQDTLCEFKLLLQEGTQYSSKGKQIRVGQNANVGANKCSDSKNKKIEK